MSNMENQVLSIEQMQELKELGIDIYKASILWYPQLFLNEEKHSYVASHYLTLNQIKKDVPFWNTRVGKETIPAFTLQDILEILPEVIMTEDDNFELYLNTFQCYILYKDPKHNKLLHAEYGSSILEAAFNALKWCKQNNYI